MDGAVAGTTCRSNELSIPSTMVVPAVGNGRLVALVAQTGSSPRPPLTGAVSSTWRPSYLRSPSATPRL
eukprot:3541649-Alexandrium_andersonii.AAC.1